MAATDSDHHAALSFIRVTLGASDLSPSAYSFADISGDSLLAHFSLGRAANMLQVLKDIMGINPRARMHLVPWSPPAWMKTHRAMAGGGLDPAHYGAYAAYLARAVGAFRDQLGAPPYAIAIQNEPQNGDGTYPTCAMSVDAMGQVATQLHANLAKAGLGSTKIIGFEVCLPWPPAMTSDARSAAQLGERGDIPRSADAEVRECLRRWCVPRYFFVTAIPC
jgi:O-glycosyl hydrolase